MTRYFTLFLIFACCLNATVSQGQTVEEFVPFVPENAESILAVKVLEILKDPGASWILDQQVINYYVPAESGGVEWLAIAGSTDEILALQHIHYGTYDAIASQLAGEDVQPNSRSCANILNKRFVAFVQFHFPLTDQAIINWLAGDKQDTFKFKTNQRNGYQVIESHHVDACKVVRLDERTFVVGGHDEMDSAIARNKTAAANLLVRHCTGKLLECEFQAIINVNRMIDRFGNGSLPIDGLEDAQWLSLQLDFSGPVLFTAEAFFPNADSARKTATTARAFHKEQIEALSAAVLEQTGYNSASGNWLFSRTLDVLKTMEFSRSENKVLATVPRPVGWIELVTQFTEHSRKLEKEMNAEFEEIAKQLDDAAEAAAEAGLKSLENVVDEE